LLGVILTVFLGFKLPASVIAIATAIFFGLCANIFLPTYIGALFWKGMTKAGAIASMLTGFLGTAFWLLFIHEKESAALGLCNLLFKKPTLASAPWTVIDPIVTILPISFVVAAVVSLFTKKLSRDHIKECFKHF
jgi:SSS family solute:Na+ symporter